MEELAFLTNVLLAAFDRHQLEQGYNVADAIRAVVEGVESGALGELAPHHSAATEQLLTALKLEGPIALFRRRAVSASSR
jgi:hypothetical protein